MPTKWKSTLLHLPVDGQSIYFRLFPGVWPPVKGTFSFTSDGNATFVCQTPVGDNISFWEFDIEASRVHSWRPQ